MMLAMGGDRSKLFRLQFCRANVLCVENLTHDTNGVQDLSVHNEGFLQIGDGGSGQLTSQNTQFTAKFNYSVALTPPRSAAIISVSVRSAEVRLGLYV